MELFDFAQRRNKRNISSLLPFWEYKRTQCVRERVTKGSIKYFTLLLSGHALREERKHENQYVSCM